MILSGELKAALGVALNEASLLGFELHPEQSLAGATLSVLSLPADGGAMPDDSRVQLLFYEVSRLAVSLRAGRWDDPAAPTLAVTVPRLLETVQAFGGLPVYGWDFFDSGEKELQQWGDRLSLDWRSAQFAAAAHTLTLFQEGPERHLDLCVWFSSLEARTPNGQVIPLDEFAAAGKRWWDAFYGHDPRTQGLGIIPMK